ncbi:UNVERIFIED_CONTAM: hypothetical protein BEN50_13880 [Euhalothece sp. KZN 001]
MISEKIVMTEGKIAQLNILFNNNLTALLINDLGGTLTKDSPIEDVVALELADENNYERKQITIKTPILFGGKTISENNVGIVFSALGGDLIASHVAFIVGGNDTIGDTTGSIEILDPFDQGNSITIPDGKGYTVSLFLRGFTYFIADDGN